MNLLRGYILYELEVFNSTWGNVKSHLLLELHTIYSDTEAVSLKYRLRYQVLGAKSLSLLELKGGHPLALRGLQRIPSQ